MTPFLFGEGKINILTIIFSHSQHCYASESNYHTLNKTHESFSLPSTLRLPERQGFYISNLHYPGEGNGYPLWRQLGVQSVAAFHWQSCDSLSLAGLLLGEEKFFLPLAGL